MLWVDIHSVDSDSLDTQQRESQVVLFKFIGIYSIHRSSAKDLQTIFKRGISTTLFLSTGGWVSFLVQYARLGSALWGEIWLPSRPAVS